MASRIKIRQIQTQKLESGEFRAFIGIISAAVFLAWMIVEITLGR